MKRAEFSRVTMILPCGAFIQVRRAGIDANRPQVTAHLIDVWESKAKRDAGKPADATHDVLTPWAGPHDNPGGRLTDILDQWVKRGGLRRPSGLKKGLIWGNGPDAHGNLNHPSMNPFKVSP